MAGVDAYRLGDGAPVTFESARAIWSVVAREVLAETARHYNAVIAETDVAKQVQQRSGVHTRSPVASWLPAVLDDVTKSCAADGGGDLASLCRRDGIGDDLGHAEERLRCYRELSVDLPLDGGRPSLLQRPAAPRPARVRTPTAPAPRKRTETPPAICPTCFMALPTSGRCDNCA